MCYGSLEAGFAGLRAFTDISSVFDAAGTAAWVAILTL
jgi:hypothetical protein